MTKNEINIEQVKQEVYNMPKSIFNERFTKTTQFLLPAIDLNIKKPAIFQYFDNAFLDDDAYKHNYECCVFVLFKTRNLSDVTWQNIYSYLIRKPEYVSDYNIGMKEESHQVMMVFQIPEIYHDVYYKFKKGRYSEFSAEYKSKFPQEVYPDGKATESIVWGAMYKSPKLKELIEKEFYGENSKYSLDEKTDEYWERPRRHREHFRCDAEQIEKFNEKIKSLSYR